MEMTDLSGWHCTVLLLNLLRAAAVAARESGDEA